MIDHAPYHGVQLHPRDCRAAFIEFNHTEGSDDILGPYPPAGPDWQKSIRKDVTQALIGVEMESPEPQDWRSTGAGSSAFPSARTQGANPNWRCPIAPFVSSRAPASHERPDVSGRRCRQGARCREGKGLRVNGNSFFLGGVNFQLVA